MNRPMFRGQSRHFHSCYAGSRPVQCFRSLAAALLMLFSTMYTACVGAQWVVNDPVQTGNAVLHYADMIERWIKTAKHYADTVAFWEQQLVKIKSLQFSLFTLKHSFPEIPDNYGVAQACPGAEPSLTDITGVLGTLAGNLTSKDITSQQREVCVVIQKTLNRKYSATREYLERIDTQASALRKLADLRLKEVQKSPGALSSYSADTNKFTADMTQARDTWKTNMEQLDAQLDMLRRRQSVLSRQAIDGPPKTLLGTLVEMGALRAALSR